MTRADGTTADWRPAATLRTLERRASILTTVRRFFAERGVLEVETPVLAQRTVTDPAIESIEASFAGGTWYLQTSPEFHMKRLLAAGAPAIVRIGPVFRADEQGRVHNPEFTMVEWYRPGFDARGLELEVAALVDCVLGKAEYAYLAYDALLDRACAVNAGSASIETLLSAAAAIGVVPSSELAVDRQALLDLLFDAAVRKQAGRVFVEEFPERQAALARTRRRPDGVTVADRFELVIDGLEIANGYVELTDAAELAERMRVDCEIRGRTNQRVPLRDDRLLDAMRSGLPEMSGVALGFDRLVMLAVGAKDLAEVIAFPASRA